MYDSPDMNVLLTLAALFPMTTNAPECVAGKSPALGLVVDWTPGTAEIHQVIEVPMTLSYN